MPTHKNISSTRWQAVGWMLLNTLCWGAALPLVKPGFDVTTPFRFLLFRFTVATILLLPFLIWQLKKHPQLFKALPKIVGLELIGTTLALSLLYVGLNHTSALEASLLTTTAPLFITLGGVIFLSEKQDKHEWFGLGLALLGTVLMVLEPLLNGSWHGGNFSFIGNVLVFLQNITVAVYYLLAKRFYRDLPKLFATGVSFVVGMATFFLISLVEVGGTFSTFWTKTQQDWQAPSVWIAVGYMAVFGSVLGLTAYIKGQDGIEASEASLFTYLQPLVFVPLSWLMFGDELTPLLITALGLIALGVIVAEWRGSLNKKQKKSPSSAHTRST